MKNLATGQIRMDHTHAMTAFHRYKIDDDPQIKQGLARHICAALDIHGHLEEEIFYPAVRAAGIDSEMIDSQSLPEHARQRRLIETVRNMDPNDPRFDSTFMELMRVTMHHVADEETTLLPDVERQMSREQLMELGRQMARRRMELSKELSGEIAGSLMQATPTTAKILAGGALLAGTFLVGRSMMKRAGSSAEEAEIEYPHSAYGNQPYRQPSMPQPEPRI